MTATVVGCCGFTVVTMGGCVLASVLHPRCHTTSPVVGPALLVF